MNDKPKMSAGYRYNNDDGSVKWFDAEPIGPQGPVAKLEFWLRAKGLKRIPNALGRWDERKLS